MTAWREEAIARRHNRAAFRCGEPALDLFLQRYARQSHESGAAKTWVAVDEADGRTVLGYYSVSPAAVEYARTPEVVRRGLGHYEVPVYRLARLAVDERAQGRGMGGELFVCAARRCQQAAEVAGGVAMLIDAKNERVAAWYASLGAVAFPASPLTLLFPLSLVPERRVR